VSCVAQPVFFIAESLFEDMTIEIRPAERSDIDGIQSVATRAWHSAHGPIIGTEAVEMFLHEYYDTASFESRIDHDPTILDVAVETRDDIVGYVLASPAEEDNTTFSLSHIYVAQNHQSEGIGRQLLDHTEQVVSQNGGERITLGVMAENDRAVNFYESAGYSRSDTFYDDRIDASGYTYINELD
jgi:ribosomal protein S18 acetylase RimI-like enzyme